jgi:hypothetical protein
MTTTNQPMANDLKLMHWMTRGISLITDLFYGVILFAAFVNEDPPTLVGKYILAGVAGYMVASLLAWRWPRAGGMTILLIAGALAVSVLVSTAIQGYDLLATLLALAIYPVPAVLVGALFLADGQFDRRRESSP